MLFDMLVPAVSALGIVLSALGLASLAVRRPLWVASRPRPIAALLQYVLEDSDRVQTARMALGVVLFCSALIFAATIGVALEAPEQYRIRAIVQECLQAVPTPDGQAVVPGDFPFGTRLRGSVLVWDCGTDGPGGKPGHRLDAAVPDGRPVATSRDEEISVFLVLETSSDTIWERYGGGLLPAYEHHTMTVALVYWPSCSFASWLEVSGVWPLSHRAIHSTFRTGWDELREVIASMPRSP
jgi:hypothetical protein